MTREECEMLILQHVKEIKDIVKQYDTSDKPYLVITINSNFININNAYWGTITR